MNASLKLPEAGIDYQGRNLSAALDETSYWSSHFGALMLELLELRPGVVGLDLACGSGFPALQLAQAHGLGSRFVGVDILEPCIELARAKRDAYGVPNVDFLVADAASLPFEDGAFNLITMNLGINNFENPRAVLFEAGRVAAAGARFALTTNPKGHLSEFYEAFRIALAEEGLADLLPRVDANVDHRLDLDALKPLLEAANFEVARSAMRPLELRYLDFQAFLDSALTRFGFLPGWYGVVPAAHRQQIFQAIEMRLPTPLTLTVPMLYVEAIRK